MLTEKTTRFTRYTNKTFSRMFLAERPRRILSVLNLPEIAVVTDKKYYHGTLSIFMGLPIMIHPSRAHVRLGGSDKIFKFYMDELVAHGFDGNLKQGIKDSADINKAIISYWDTHPTKEQAVKDSIVPYNDSHEAKLLANPCVDGPRTVRLMGRYWRADLLGYFFATAIGNRMPGYYGSYAEALFRELSIVSPLSSIMNPCVLDNKDSEEVKSRYLEIVLSSQMAADYRIVEGVDYPVELRSQVCIAELIRQPRVDKEPPAIDENGDLIKNPTRKETRLPPLPDEVIEDQLARIAGRAPPPPMASLARYIMNELNLPIITTYICKTRGVFSLSLLAGSVVIIDPSGIYLKLFVKPHAYASHIAQLRAANLDESPKLLNHLVKENSSKCPRDWWDSLTDTQQAEVTAFFQGLEHDNGPPSVQHKGGRYKGWMVGLYWRADLLPYIFWGNSGDKIPRYRNSAQERFLNEQRFKQPLARILGVEAILTTGQLRTRQKRVKDDGTPSLDSMIVLAAASIPDPPPQVTSTEVVVMEPPPPSYHHGGTLAEIRKQEMEKLFTETYITRTQSRIPIPSASAARHILRSLLERAWIAAETTAANAKVRAELEAAARNAELEERVKQLEEQCERQIKLLQEAEAEAKKYMKHRIEDAEQLARAAVPQVMGAIGEDEAEPLIISAAAGKFGLLKRNCGERGKCADFIHESLNYGFMLHEVKNGVTTISSADGVEKLIRDIDECEKERGGIPCFAAILYSLRSDIANCKDQPITTFLAPNGHTLMICVNNIKNRVEASKGVLTCPMIFEDAIMRVYNRMEDRIRTFFDVTRGVTDTEFLLRQVKNILWNIHPEQSILSTLASSGDDIELFIDNVMRPKEGLEPARGRTPKKSSGGLRRVPSFATRTASVRSLRWQQATEAGTIPPTDSGVAESPRGLEQGEHVIAPHPEMMIDGAGGTVIEATSSSGELTRTAIVDGRFVPLVDGIEMPSSFIPLEWHIVFDVTKPWGPVKTEIAKTIISLCVVDPEGCLTRYELTRRIAQYPEITCNAAGVRDNLAVILLAKYKGSREINGIRWKSEV